MLHYHKKSILCFYNLIELYNMRMSHNLKNMYFSRDSFYVVDIFNLPFIQYLYSYFLSSVNVKSLFNFTKCSLTKSFFYFVIANHFIAFFHMNVNLFLFWHQNFCYSSAFINVFDVSIAILPHKFRTDLFLRCLMWIIIDS